MNVSVYSPIHLYQYVPSVDIGLSVVRPHTDGLSVEGVGLLQAGFVPGYQVGQVEEHIEMVGGDAPLIALPGFTFGQQGLGLGEEEQWQNREDTGQDNDVDDDNGR